MKVEAGNVRQCFANCQENNILSSEMEYRARELSACRASGELGLF